MNDLNSVRLRDASRLTLPQLRVLRDDGLLLEATTVRSVCPHCGDGFRLCGVHWSSAGGRSVLRDEARASLVGGGLVPPGSRLLIDLDERRLLFACVLAFGVPLVWVAMLAWAVTWRMTVVGVIAAIIAALHVAVLIRSRVGFDTQLRASCRTIAPVSCHTIQSQ